MGKWYAVVTGRIPGFYTSWPACQNQIKGFSKATYKGFTSKKDAAEWMLQMESIAETRYSEQLKIEIRIAIEGTVALNRITSPDDFESSEPSPFPWDPLEKYELPVISSDIKVGQSEFFALDRDVLDLNKVNPALNTIVIYCDGSKMPTVNHLGSGVYCRFKGKDYGLSLPFTDQVASKYLFTEKEKSELSSPTMEYLSFSETLWAFISVKLPQIDGVVGPLKTPKRLLFICDYIGVRNFTLGAWTPKETHVIKIYQTCCKIIDFLKERNIHVQVQHCDGHNNFFGNELSDIYAKSTQYSNNLEELVEVYSSFLDQ